MRVLFVYKYLTAGGVEAVLRARLAGLPAEGIEAHAWFLHDLGGRPTFAGLAPLVHVGELDAFARFVDEGGFDLVGTIDSEEVLPALAAEGAPPWFLECHSGYLENLDYLGAAVAQRPRAVLTPSRAQAELIAPRLGGLVPRVVPNALSADFAAPLSAVAAPPPRPVVAWIGRLDAHKNWRAFLALGERLLGTVDALELWLVGRAIEEDGADRLLAAARDTGTLGRLRWLDGVPHPRMPALLDAVRACGGLVVSTSKRESFGLTVVEAMARGCAVLAPAVPPFPELVEEASCLFAADDLGDAAAKALRLLRDDGRREEAGRRGRERALARFAPEVAIAALARELRALVASQPSAGAGNPRA